MTDESHMQNLFEPAQDGSPAAPGGAAEGGGAEEEFVYHLYLDRAEAELTASALRLLIADEAHEQRIRGLARGVLGKLERPPGESAVARVPLSPPEMKIAHTALRLLLDDLQREQADERRLLQQILSKLPDEHAIRAIVLE